MTKKEKFRKILSYVLLVIGVLPFLLTLFVGIYSAIAGTHDGICIMCDRDLIYGMEAFKVTIAFAVYLFWPIYIIGLLFIVISIIMLVYIRKKKRQ